ncbi:MAG: hypothetical protein ACFFCW_38440, partial [Candidatus Hodarchaeota archaeon]
MGKKEIKKISVIHPHLVYPYGATKYIINLVNELVKPTNMEISFITLRTLESMENLLSPEIKLVKLQEAMPKSFKFWAKLFLLRRRISKLIDEIKPNIIL